MGDIIHTLPAITDAVAAIPGIRFDWVVEEGFTEIPKWHPAVDQVIPVAIRRWRKNIFKSWGSQEWRSFKNEMKHHQYDFVIDAQGLMKSAFVTRFVNAPVCGYDRLSVKEKLATISYNHCFSVSKRQHAVERVRELFAKSLNYQKPKTTGNFGLQRDCFGKRDDDSPFVTFFHATTRDDKHWPEEHWLALCKEVTDAGFYVKVPWYTEEEKVRAKKIAAVSDKAEVLPKLNLQGIASVLAESQAFVAVDTGLGHLGAALDIPGVSLYGPTKPRKIGAYGDQQIHLRADKHKDALQHRALKTITPEKAWQHLQNLIEQSGKE